MSASIVTDRANLRKRGTMLTYIFANQVRALQLEFAGAAR